MEADSRTGSELEQAVQTNETQSANIYVAVIEKEFCEARIECEFCYSIKAHKKEGSDTEFYGTDFIKGEGDRHTALLRAASDCATFLALDFTIENSVFGDELYKDYILHNGIPPAIKDEYGIQSGNTNPLSEEEFNTFKNEFSRIYPILYESVTAFRGGAPIVIHRQSSEEE